MPNPHAPDDTKLIETISRGEFTINGLRNQDIRILLFQDEPSSVQETRRRSAAITRKLRLLRAHGLIKKKGLKNSSVSAYRQGKNHRYHPPGL